MLMTQKIGAKIAETRKSNQLSQAELADKLCISPQAVGKWERGESMPDITTFVRLAELFQVDLNYFTDQFDSTSNAPTANTHQKRNPNWDLSEGNWVDIDFSGLKNLAEKFVRSNIQNSQFKNADLSKLTLKHNHVINCDFSNAKFDQSHFISSNLAENNFTCASFKDAQIEKSYLTNSNFAGADLSGLKIKAGGFEKVNFIGSVFQSSEFKNTYFGDLTFTGEMQDCSFDRCGFSRVKFENISIRNTFFKHNRKMKKVIFTNCKVDQITYSFLKSNGAQMDGISLI